METNSPVSSSSRVRKNQKTDCSRRKRSCQTRKMNSKMNLPGGKIREDEFADKDDHAMAMYFYSIHSLSDGKVSGNRRRRKKKEELTFEFRIRLRPIQKHENFASVREGEREVKI
ncbi:unnamed protein product [Angiostrongylus costaricensis]|uniref:Kinesin motor domain-containing protein n=1 Tax=Angiostrongylus costaricensis TaxID=334426 RepID=A0A0R3PK93_ANGCS|nr:unnamed protein product [Angiostrongylus costaricensis]